MQPYMPPLPSKWLGAISSVGRAPCSHRGGHWFKSSIAHHFSRHLAVLNERSLVQKDLQPLSARLFTSVSESRSKADITVNYGLVQQN